MCGYPISPDHRRAREGMNSTESQPLSVVACDGRPPHNTDAMTRTRTLMTLCAAVAIVACDSDDGDSGASDPSRGKADEDGERLERTLVVGDTSEGEPLAILGASLREDQLALFVQDGCFEGSYELVWDGVLSDDAPPAATLFPRRGDGPACAETRDVPIQFDVHGLARALGSSDGEVTILLEDQDPIAYRFEDFHLQLGPTPEGNAGTSISSARIEDDELILDVFHSESCGANEIALFWDPQTQSDPSTVDLTLFRDAGDGACVGGGPEKLRFYLGSLREQLSPPLTRSTRGFRGCASAGVIAPHDELP